MPVLVIVGGPNGSGKTTLVRSGVLADALAVPAVSINADDHAKALASGGQPSDEQSLAAAQFADALLDERIAAGTSVVVETVLSSEKYKSRLLAAKAAGFRTVLVYVTLQQPEDNVARVALRLVRGGHGVPTNRIIARRTRSHHMFAWFSRAADAVFVFDNSRVVPKLVAEKQSGGWTLHALDRLAPDLAEVVRVLAAEPSE